MVCNGYVTGRIAASRGLATFSNLEMQHSPKIFCIFLQKVLAKNKLDKLEKLMQKRDELRGKELMEAFANSERSFEEVMRFLSGNEVDDE